MWEDVSPRPSEGLCGEVREVTGSGATWPRVDRHFHCSLAVWPGASFLTSLCFAFPSVKGDDERIGRRTAGPCKVPGTAAGMGHARVSPSDCCHLYC